MLQFASILQDEILHFLRSNAYEIMFFTLLLNI